MNFSPDTFYADERAWIKDVIKAKIAYEACKIRENDHDIEWCKTNNYDPRIAKMTLENIILQGKLTGFKELEIENEELKIPTPLKKEDEIPVIGRIVREFNELNDTVSRLQQNQKTIRNTMKKHF